MRFTFAALLALASAVIAETTPGFDVISKPGKGDVVAAGSTYTIEWAPSPKHGGTVTISLLAGADDKNLHNIAVLSKGVDETAGEYDWEVGKAYPDLASWTIGKRIHDPVYGIKIAWEEDDEIFQYSFPFKISQSGAGGGNGGGSKPSATADPIPSESSSSAPQPTSPGDGSSTGGPSPSATGGPSASDASSTGSAEPTGFSSSFTPSGTASVPPSGASSAPSGSATSGASGSFAISGAAVLGGLAVAVFAL